MLSYHRRDAEKERALAERALDIFLNAPKLMWVEAYAAAAFERAEGATRLAAALELVTKGFTFGQATAMIAPEDPHLPAEVAP